MMHALIRVRYSQPLKFNVEPGAMWIGTWVFCQGWVCALVGEWIYFGKWFFLEATPVDLMCCRESLWFCIGGDRGTKWQWEMEEIPSSLGYYGNWTEIATSLSYCYSSYPLVYIHCFWNTEKLNALCRATQVVIEPGSKSSSLVPDHMLSAPVIPWRKEDHTDTEEGSLGV